MTNIAESPGAATHPSVDGGAHRHAKRLLFVLPLAAMLSIAVMFWLGLGRDPRLVPSPLIGKPVPAFSLPPVQGRMLGLSSGDLTGQVSLVNVFASWCVACRAEHPLLLRLHSMGVVPIHGLDYKDEPGDAARWLDEMGDPYTRTGADQQGRVGLDWGVYGVPETFVVDRDGRIAFKQIGPIDENVLERTLLPLIARLQKSSSPPVR